MSSDADGQIRVIGGESCCRVAASLSGSALVFSIHSDDRLPVAVERILESAPDGSAIPSDIHIVGDLHGVPVRHWRLREYLHKMLSGFMDRHFRLFWYDGDLIRTGSGFYVSHPLCIDHLATCTVKNEHRANEKPHDLPDGITDETLACISSIIGMAPRAGFNELGELTGLDFCVGESYPQNIMSHLDDRHISDVLQRVAGLTSLKVLRLSFLEDLRITELPISLQKLDCRGCGGMWIDEKVIPATLNSLNLSACKLTALPDFMPRLVGLQELLLYKNGITSINQSALPEGLHRLSLYRNRIIGISLDLVRLQQLEELNIGANPLQYLHLENGTSDRNLRINLRKVTVEALDFRVDCPYSLSFA